MTIRNHLKQRHRREASRIWLLAVALLVFAGLASCGGQDGTPQPLGIDAVSPTVAFAGDTLTLDGRFAGDVIVLACNVPLQDLAFADVTFGKEPTVTWVPQSDADAERVYPHARGILTDVGQAPTCEVRLERGGVDVTVGAAKVIEVGMASPPDAPTELTVSNADSSAIVDFVASKPNGSPVTNYAVQLGEGDWTPLSPSDVEPPITISGLVNGETYPARIRAMSAVGPSEPSEVIVLSPTGLALAPGAPVNLAAENGDGEVTVTFDPPTENAENLVNFEVQLDDGEWVPLDPATTTAPIVIQGLENGKTYLVRLRAVSDVGPGAPSDAVRVSPVGLPFAPTITTVTNSDATVAFDFTLGDDNGSEITNVEYIVDVSSVDASPSDTWLTVSPSTVEGPITVTGLANGTTYALRLRAINAVGAGAPSEAAPAAPFTIPGAPTITTVTESDQAVEVAFTMGDANGSVVSNVEYVVSTVDLSMSDAWVPLDPASLTGPFTISGLTNGESYFVRVRSRSNAGSGVPSAASTVSPFTTPGAPTITTIVAGETSLDVQWTELIDDGGRTITGYEYSVDGGAFVSTGSTSKSVTITGLMSETSYGVRVRAVNQAGSGEASASVTGSTTPPPITLKLGRLGTGGSHVLALVDEGSGTPNRMYAFGNNDKGQLGLGDTVRRDSFVATSYTDFTSVGAGSQFSFAIEETGGSTKVRVWGFNGNQEFGSGVVGNPDTPEELPLPSGAAAPKQVVGAGAASFMLDTNGDVWAWGWQQSGRLGNGIADRNYGTAVQVNIDESVAEVAGGETFSIALDTEGHVWSWGNNTNGSLGRELDGETATGTPGKISVTDDVQFASVAASYGGNAVAAVDTSGRIWTWGNGPIGRSGDPAIPARIVSTTDIAAANGGIDIDIVPFAKVAVGRFAMVALDRFGRLWSWAYSESTADEAGRTSSYATVPVMLTAATTGVPGFDEQRFVDVVQGDGYGFALHEDGNLWVWNLTYDGTKYVSPSDIGFPN